MNKHTRGQWKVFESDVTGLSVNAPGERICDVHRNPKEEHRANARLIASAPDMLAALQEIAGYYVAESRQNDWVECCKLQEIARRALSTPKERKDG